MPSRETCEHGAYPLADDTDAELLGRLGKQQYAGVPTGLRSTIVACYARKPAASMERKERKRAGRIRQRLDALRAAAR